MQESSKQNPLNLPEAEYSFPAFKASGMLGSIQKEPLISDSITTAAQNWADRNRSIYEGIEKAFKPLKLQTDFFPENCVGKHTNEVMQIVKNSKNISAQIEKQRLDVVGAVPSFINKPFFMDMEAKQSLAASQFSEQLETTIELAKEMIQVNAKILKVPNNLVELNERVKNSTKTMVSFPIPNTVIESPLSQKFILHVFKDFSINSKIESLSENVVLGESFKVVSKSYIPESLQWDLHFDSEQTAEINSLMDELPCKVTQELLENVAISLVQNESLAIALSNALENREDSSILEFVAKAAWIYPRDLFARLPKEDKEYLVILLTVLSFLFSLRK